MYQLLLLLNSKDRQEYLDILLAANLPGIVIQESTLENADIIFGEPSIIKDMLGDAKNLKWVQATWAGVEPLLTKGLRRDYILTNARGVFGGLMSEYVFGYLLFRERRILEHLQNQSKQKWNSGLTGTLRGKTLGLMGVGSIGSHLAETGKHFGMNIRGYTKHSEECISVDRYYHGDDILSFADGLDVLVSVLPNTQLTRKIIDSKLIDKLHEGAVFINAGRGNAVDEEALIKALNSGRLGTAILDVFEKEPLPQDHPFWTSKNLIISSHSAAPSFPGDICRIFIANYLKFIEGKALNYQVDFEAGY